MTLILIANLTRLPVALAYDAVALAHDAVDIVRDSSGFFARGIEAEAIRRVAP
ncbi:hypothetical protein OAM37_00555 [bacterium]|nr:hypothetical protein [bacterium]